MNKRGSSSRMPTVFQRGLRGSAAWLAGVQDRRPTEQEALLGHDIEPNASGMHQPPSMTGLTSTSLWR